MWQSFLEQRPNLDAQLIAVAMDAVPERVYALPEAQGTSFLILTDKHNVLGERYQFTAVPNCFVIDPDGVIRYARYGDFSIKREPGPSEVLAALAGESVTAASGTMPAPNPEALRLFEQGEDALERGDRTAALDLWRRARDLDPDNWIIRKQVWSVEHPELFYPAIDLNWQKEELQREGYSGR